MCRMKHWNYAAGGGLEADKGQHQERLLSWASACLTLHFLVRAAANFFTFATKVLVHTCISSAKTWTIHLPEP